MNKISSPNPEEKRPPNFLPSFCENTSDEA
jgi:hypothetical protein